MATKKKSRVKSEAAKGLHTAIRDAHLALERTAVEGLNALVSGGGNFGPPGMGDIMRGMVAYSVVAAAKQVLRIEDGLRTNPERAEIIAEDLKLTREHYTRTLLDARKTLGADFDTLYAQARDTENECARTNLDSSNGTLYCYVIPKGFNDDGTHEPLGPRDFPWGASSSRRARS